MLTLFFVAALSRSTQDTDKRRRFAIYADEAYMLLGTDAIEHMITEARKFHVDLCIAHHFLRQFDTRKIDALSTVGTTLIGRIDKRDAQYLVKDFQDKVDPSDIMQLRSREMIARIKSNIVRIRTQDLPTPPSNANPAEVIENSHRQYYKPRTEVARMIANRNARFDSRFAAAADADASEFTAEELSYDEF